MLYIRIESIIDTRRQKVSETHFLTLSSYNPDDTEEYIDTEDFLVSTHNDKIQAETMAGVLRNILRNGGAEVTML